MIKACPLTFAVLIVMALADQAGAQQYLLHPAPASRYTELAGSLSVEPPVEINGPFPFLVRRVRAGDTVVLQIRYPVAPPMPKSVAISTDHKQFTLLGVATTSTEVAVLEYKPRSDGKIGVGFVQVMLKAVKGDGRENATVHVKLADGKVKDIPFAFDVYK